MGIYFTAYFKRQLKKLMKKYSHAKEDLLNGLKNIDLRHEISIGKSIYKIRIKSSDMNRGKSGGFRSYVYFYVKKDLLVPLCIYSKSDQSFVSEQELQFHVDRMNEELAIVLE